MSATLHGIGLGPGDPELITLKAARLIAQAPVVAYPALAGGDSLARTIAAGLIAPDAREMRIEVPMTPARAPAQAAYDRAASDIAAHLDAGRDVAVLCEGDPFFYGSFMYLHARLAGRYRVQVVPGVSSMSASAAALGLPLAARNEVVSVIPAPLPEADLRARIIAADSAVIIKVGRHMARLRAVIADLGLSANAHYIERATLARERLMPLSEAPREAPYFSMILVVKGADPWL